MSATLLEDALIPGPSAARARGRAGGRRLLGLVVPLTLLALWHVLTTQGVVNTRLFPAPGTVFDALGRFFLGDSRETLAGVVPFTGAGFDHLQASLTRCAFSWLLAVAVGTAVGLLNALRAVPLFAWLPLALVWFGLGERAARAIIFVGALWPVLVAVSDATSRVPRGHVETARMLGTPSRSLWLRVYLPSALPEVVTGLRLSLTLAWTCVIVGELSGTARGVGAMMSAARETGRTEEVVVGILVFAAVGLVADLVLRAVTRPFVRWSVA